MILYPILRNDQSYAQKSHGFNHPLQRYDRRCGLEPFFVDVATPVSLKHLFQLPSRANAGETRLCVNAMIVTPIFLGCNKY